MSASSDDRSEESSGPENGKPIVGCAPTMQAIRAENILSFPPSNGVSNNEMLELRNLNILIGPNGSGKSNLLEVIHLLRSTSGDLRPVLSRRGGVGEWIWKGNPHDSAKVKAFICYPNSKQTLVHNFEFRSHYQQFQLDSESILKFVDGKFEDGEKGFPKSPYSFNLGSSPLILSSQSESSAWIEPDNFNPSLSILAQRDAPEYYPEISTLKEFYSHIRIYREWSMGRNTLFREPQRADLRTDRLEEDFSNLGLFLSKLRRKPKAKQALLAHLQNLYEGLSDFDVSVEGGTVQVFFTEGDFVIPATRLSDGTLRYLCLLAILCDPEPPLLIGIEEPELGLHPDLLPKLADLLVEASTRCQLIVTTHSDILVDALSEQPESIVVCEKHERQTSMRRLDAKELAPWLEKYRLGQLWISGELGGTRW